MQPWIQRTKRLTQALIISGTLNIGFIATFIYSVIKEKQEILPIELKAPVACKTGQTNADILRSYTLLSFQDLILHLENKDLIEEGLSKRDLSLGCLVAFHHFHLDKALGGIPLQKRVIPFANADGQERIELPVFPGLADYHFQAILHYVKTEKWPLTSQGLFYEIKRSQIPRDPSLLEAFSLAPECHLVSALFSKTGIHLPREEFVELLSQGEWSTLAQFTSEQRRAPDLTPERRRAFLLAYLDHHSKIAARLLLNSDPEFALKRLEDAKVIDILELYGSRTQILETYAKELLASPRTDAVHRRAASLLYAFVGEKIPEPYLHTAALNRFLPQSAPPAIVQVALPEVIPPKAERKIHTVEPGENLWKIARKYRVSIEEIMRVNHLESERLRPGKQLEIPLQKTGQS